MLKELRFAFEDLDSREQIKMLGGILGLLEQIRSNMGSRYDEVGEYDRLNLVLEGVGITGLIEASKNTLQRAQDSSAANLDEFWVALEKYSVPLAQPKVFVKKKSGGHGG